uniref:Uncharacterized protein n=1 Tax=Panagrolaimus davidi TaxID=227884 RepID=A0A914QV82_9BILA
MDIFGVSKSNQSNKNIKSKASKFSSKHAQFYSTYFRQNFSLPNNIIYYISKNPKSAKLYQKMIQTCKYFFIKNPIIVIDSRLAFCENQWLIKRKPYDISNVTCKFWITDDLSIASNSLKINEDMNKNVVSSIIPKVYKCASKYLTLFNQNIFFHDLYFLIKSAEEIYFSDVCVKNDDGSNVAIEKIIEIAVKAKSFTL